jgi:hypothetical protein
VLAGVAVALVAVAMVGWVLLRADDGQQPPVVGVDPADPGEPGQDPGEPGQDPGLPGPGRPGPGQPGPGGQDPGTGPSPAPPAAEALGLEPLIPGWQVVVVPQRGLAYDVPPDWRIEEPDIIIGFEEEDPSAPFGYSPRVVMSGVARGGDRGQDCATDSGDTAASYTGTSGAGEVVDTAQMAGYLAGEWASAAFENDAGPPAVSQVAAEPYAANGLTGHVVRATADALVGSPPDPCAPVHGRVAVASVLAPAGDDVYNFVVYGDADGPHALPEETVAMILSTLRPIEVPPQPAGSDPRG